MRKIPTLYKRDATWKVADEVNPGCEWVLAGEGIATRKYDGTCTMYDGECWWARREVKADKQAPDGFVPIETDPATGKTVGWEPIGQSPFAKFWRQAVDAGLVVTQSHELEVGTYELIGPKINGNPEHAERSTLVRHGYTASVEHVQLDAWPRDFTGLREWISGLGWEGVVWHHPDGRMVKLKARDFPRA